MSSTKTVRRFHRRERRKAKMVQYKRLPKKTGQVGHGSGVTTSKVDGAKKVRKAGYVGKTTRKDEPLGTIADRIEQDVRVALSVSTVDKESE